MKRSELKRKPGPGLKRTGQWLQSARKPLARTQRKQRQAVPAEVLTVIRENCGGVCVICGKACDPRRDRHHVLPVRRWPEYELEPLNQVLACLQDHMDHENAARRITLAELPAPVRYWVLERSAQSGTVHTYVQRTYPPGTPAANEQEVQHGRRRRGRSGPW